MRYHASRKQELTAMKAETPFSDLVRQAHPQPLGRWLDSAREAWLLVEEGNRLKPLIRIIMKCHSLTRKQVVNLLLWPSVISRDDMKIRVTYERVKLTTYTTLGDWLATNWCDPAEYRRITSALRFNDYVAGGGGSSVAWKLEKLS